LHLQTETTQNPESKTQNYLVYETYIRCDNRCIAPDYFFNTFAVYSVADKIDLKGTGTLLAR